MNAPRRRLSLPYWVWTLVCVGVAAVYVPVWPRPDEAATLNGGAFFALRWAHPLTWVFLALATVSWGRWPRRQLARGLLIAAGLCYALFFLAVTRYT